MPVYLDYAATTPLDARVLMAMQPYLTEVCGNPSSLHCFGQAARRGVMRAREETAALIGASPSEVFFTGGGTESDNWALRGLAEERRKAGCRHIVTSAVEHPAVRETCRDLAAHGYALTEVPVDAAGRVAPSDVAGVLEGTVQGRTGETPYMRLGGSYPLVGLLVILLALIGWKTRNKPPAAQA